MAKNNQLRKLRERDGNCCHYCKEEMKFYVHGTPWVRNDRTATKDHIVPKSMGGEGRLTNFVLACALCNEKRGDNLYYCACDFCTDVVSTFMIKYFGGTIGPVKPKVWKHRGQWITSYGLNSYYSMSWEKAMLRVPTHEKANA